MQSSLDVSDEVISKLSYIYDEVMWLAKRPNVNPSGARAWYTHVTYRSVVRDIRLFTGKVSRPAVFDEKIELRLEHFKRIQSTLTKLVAEHVKNNICNPEEFISTILDCEQVHIVTNPENYAARKADGDYTSAGIELLEWNSISKERRLLIWKKVLKGKVANAKQYYVDY